MIHQYKNNGYNIVLDVNSGSVHVVDDIVYDIIALYENSSVDEIADKLKDKYKEEDIREACQEIEELKEEGQLFTDLQLLKLYAFILHTTVTLPADIVLQKKVSITEEELL